MELITLKDLVDAVSSSLKLSDLSQNGLYKVFGASGQCGYINTFKVNKDYIAVVKDGSGVGNIHYLEAKSSFLGTMLGLVPKDNVDAKYLYYLMKYLDLGKTCVGAAIPHIYFKNYCNTKIQRHTLYDQEKIVSELSSLDDLINNKKFQLKKLDELIKSRFIEMFGDISTNQHKWQILKINDFATCIAGATPSTIIDEYWTNGTIPWMSSGEVNKGRIYSTETKITKLGYDSASTKLIPAHTVVMAMAGQGKTRGTVAMAEIELCTNQSICSIVTNKTVNPEYLLAFLQGQYNELREVSNGDGGRGGLNLKIIGNFKVMIPPIELQNEFANFANLIDKSKFIVQQQIKDLQELLDSKMQEYFGE